MKTYKADNGSETHILKTDESDGTTRSTTLCGRFDGKLPTHQGSQPVPDDEMCTDCLDIYKQNQKQCITVGPTTITIPDDVFTIDDPKEAPYRSPNEYDTYRGKHTFIMVVKHTDMNSSGWYVEIIESPGATPATSKQVADQIAGWKKAIKLAQRHQLPILSYAESVSI